MYCPDGSEMIRTTKASSVGVYCANAASPQHTQQSNAKTFHFSETVIALLMAEEF